MPEINVFCEDSFHENFVGAMLRRFGSRHRVAIRCRFLSSRGGLPQMHTEFKEFLRDLGRERLPLPDSILVVLDANCEGYNKRKEIMDRVVQQLYRQYQPIISYAIPDPHIERWMLVDSAAFQTVFGRGCTLPGVKCSKDEYKRLLLKEIRESGIEPVLGGEEFAEDIVNEMNLGRAEVTEASLGLFLKSLKALFNRWSDH
ncbi:MAG: hypothetical protein ACRD3O_06725 [Terriglobia bacterium]